MKTKTTLTTLLILILVAGAGYLVYANWDSLTDNQKDSSEPATTDEVLPEENNEDQADPEGEEGTTPDNKEGVSKEEAEKIALDRFGGEVKETESDDYNGKPAWEVEIRNSKEGRIEVKVDKSTGEILDWEKD